jgi:hypothetical protein
MIDIKKSGLSQDIKEIKSKKKGLAKRLQERIISRRIVRPTKATITIQNNKPAEYVPVYFQAELKQAKDDMGFWK